MAKKNIPRNNGPIANGLRNFFVDLKNKLDLDVEDLRTLQLDKFMFMYNDHRNSYPNLSQLELSEIMYTALEEFDKDRWCLEWIDNITPDINTFIELKYPRLLDNKSNKTQKDWKELLSIINDITTDSFLYLNRSLFLYREDKKIEDIKFINDLSDTIDGQKNIFMNSYDQILKGTYEEAFTTAIINIMVLSFGTGAMNLNALLNFSIYSGLNLMIGRGTYSHFEDLVRTIQRALAESEVEISQHFLSMPKFATLLYLIDRWYYFGRDTKDECPNMIEKVMRAIIKHTKYNS